MIFKSGFPNAPDVTIVLDGASVDYLSIESIIVDVSENKHDMALVTFSGLPAKAITDYVGVPVSITISVSASRYMAFNGYVSYVEPEAISRRGLVNNSQVQKAVVHCFGASYSMVETKNKVWENVTLLNVVESLANKYNLSYSIPEDSFIWTRLLQTEQSDWSFLVNACSSLGYMVTLNKTHIHVYDIYKAIARNMPYANLFNIKGADNNPQYYPGRIMEFHGTFGDRTPDGSSDNYKIVGIDSYGQPVSVNTSDLESSGFGESVSARYTNEITTNVSSLSMLNKIAKSITRYRYPFNAKVITTGLPEPLPGSLVRVAEYDSYFDGYWVVRGIKHIVTRASYISELEISTDSTNKEQPTVNPVTPYVEPVETALVDGKWYASSVGGSAYA